MLGLKYRDECAELARRIRSVSGEVSGSLSDYGRNYLNNLLPDMEYHLRLSAHLLEKTWMTDRTLLDFGGGLGLTGLLAKSSGYSSVIYLDTYREVYEDAQILARSLGLMSNEYLLGEIGDHTKALQEVEVVVSRDVIEHIYDLEAFFAEAMQLGRLKSMYHNTSANIYSIVLKRYFNQIHLKAENKTIRDENDIKKGESEQGFRAAREHMIEQFGPDLNHSEVAKLGEKTRGLRKDDIKRAVEAFINHNELPVPPSHPGNTCDPQTGNWAERLLTWEEYREMAEGFKLDFEPGFYNSMDGKLVKKAIGGMLNTGIRAGLVGRSLWPSFTISCVREA